MAQRPPAKPTAAPATARPGQGQPRPPAPTRQSGIKVRATKVCYYDDKRRRIGDVFTISSDTFPAGHPRAGQVREFSDRYMERVDPSTPERITTGAEILKDEHDRIRKVKDQDAHADLGGAPVRASDQNLEDDDD